MSKQLTSQRFIYKIHSTRLKRAKWKLTLPMSEARRNKEVVSLSDSQVIRWLDELNGITDADERAVQIKKEIKALRREADKVANRKRIKQLYEELDTIQFKPDYLCLIIDKDKDYYRAEKGFKINDVSYKRLVGTTGGVKNSTIVYVSERLSPLLNERLDADRDMSVLHVPAKLEAYRSLACSASIPVSMPKGILVVKDPSTIFKDDYIYLANTDDGEPSMEMRYNQDVKLDAVDGCGMMLPSLAERWSKELQLGYTACGMNTRFLFEKGMVFVFDYLDFGDKVGGGNYIVKDAWGDDVDIRNVELVLTTSMVKLWSSYSSCQDYIDKALKHNYTFGITKTCPKELETEHNLNYQFIQPLDLDDNDIEELIKPTVDEINDVLGGDWRKTVLFLAGCGLDEYNVERVQDSYVKAMMIDQRILDDPYIQSMVYRNIKGRIDRAKVGVVKVHGNYSIASGDLYLLCESVYGLEPRGILKAGQVFNQFWRDYGAREVAVFRAPMSVENNIRKCKISYDESASYWFRYMTTCTVFNAWDMCMQALNGMDFDGDLTMLTDNEVILRKMKVLPALMCAQNNAVKKSPTQEDFVKSNIESFGNDIGQITNRVTSMYEVRSRYKEDTEQYNVLSYRIRCGQLLQQDAIDKAKGIISKPMSREWYDWHTANKIDDETRKAFYLSILAERKPRFMTYIYPSLKTQYNTYVKNAEENALRRFGLTIKELLLIPKESLTGEQKQFMDYYEGCMPVGDYPCVMNKICTKFEELFDKCKYKINSEDFDYTIMKSEATYSNRQYYKVKSLYESYTKRLTAFSTFAVNERLDTWETNSLLDDLKSSYKQQCLTECSNEDVLCNILLDMCYTQKATKKFVWDMCGDVIVKNLTRNNGGKLLYPTKNEDGEFSFAGKKYTIRAKDINSEEVA